MTTPECPARCWLTPKAQLRPSPIKGQGLFAITPTITQAMS
jgi:hypothetical protein